MSSQQNAWHEEVRSTFATKVTGLFMCLSSQNSGIPFNKFYCSMTKCEANYKLGSALQTQSLGLWGFLNLFEYTFI